MTSTIQYYRKRRKKLLINIILRNNYRHVYSRLKIVFEPFCEHCRVSAGRANQLHIDHPEGDGRNKDCAGGWQRVYRHERDFTHGVYQKVLCDVCHYLYERMRHEGDGTYNQAHTILKRGRPWLDKYDDHDPDFMLEVRRGLWAS